MFKDWLRTAYVNVRYAIKKTLSKVWHWAGHSLTILLGYVMALIGAANAFFSNAISSIPWDTFLTPEVTAVFHKYMPQGATMLVLAALVILARLRTLFNE